jgi:A/G-specific adenine glycosylase
MQANWDDYAHKLVMWYEIHQRRLPWRETQDAYAIWVSETMLQQTRVETVIPYYHAFLSSFPTIRDLALAEEEVVLKHWQGLGYYSRVRNLHRAAKTVLGQYGGVIPSEPEEFSKLPGVGPYTTGAVMSIAFNKPVPAIDGNVLRVMARFLGIRDPIELSSVKRRIEERVQAWLDASQPRQLTQSLMELGAIVCTPRSPKCLVCPIQSGCTAYREGLVSSLPVRQKKKERKLVDVASLWCDRQGEVLMQRRSESGLLAGMWQLPSVEVPVEGVAFPELTMAHRAQLIEMLRQAFSVPDLVADGSVDFALVGVEKHIFTHIEWRVSVFRPVGFSEAELGNISEGRKELQWVNREELRDLTLPRVYEKIVESLILNEEGVGIHGAYAG